MGKTVCSKCGFEVDSGKAFCPDCGEPLVEEKKSEASSEFFDAGSTKQFSASIFNMIVNADEPGTEAPAKTEKRVYPKVTETGVSSMRPIGAPKAKAPVAAPAPASEAPATRPAERESQTRVGSKVLLAILLAIALVVAAYAALIYLSDTGSM